MIQFWIEKDYNPKVAQLNEKKIMVAENGAAQANKDFLQAVELKFISTSSWRSLMTFQSFVKSKMQNLNIPML